MADYRLDCCGGFPGHKLQCNHSYSGFIEDNSKIIEDARWKEFFDSLTEEEIFRYIERAEKEIARQQRHVERRKRALAYLSVPARIRYLDRRRGR